MRSPLVADLAERIGWRADALHLSLDPDIVRKTKYPAYIEELPDGTVRWVSPTDL